MRHPFRFLFKAVLLLISLWSFSAFAENAISVPILAYHNFNPTIPGSMTITPEKFESQLKWIKDNGYTVIPLKNLVRYLQGENITLPTKPVVITADDGWASVYKYMVPIVKKYNVPVTLFIYPQTISHGSHAMTWDQLRELQKTGQFDIEGHTYWHPNFKQEKKKMSPEAYAKFVKFQLFNSKKILEEKMGTKITLLAWPYGIYDEYLEKEAANAGYTMAFSIKARHAEKSENAMAQPRYMIIEGQSMKTFAAIMEGHAQGKHKTPSTVTK
jgi:peptidoglycan/xylan/chitin deacetylase (PgdA/CDA1 family)